MFGIIQIYKIVDIKENVEMPEELVPYFGYQNTSLYVLKEDWHIRIPAKSRSSFKVGSAAIRDLDEYVNHRIEIRGAKQKNR